MKKLFFALMAILLIFSCTKDEQLLPDEINTPLSFGQSISNPTQNLTINEHPDSLFQTVLGEELNNPFTLRNMLRALESLCGDIDTSRIQIIATDRQVKFTPRDYDDIKRLFRDTSLILFDFPLSREIIEMGDYYIAPETGEDIPAFYSMVSDEQQLPADIPYEVIEEYAYIFDNPLLLAESFRLTGNFEHVNDYIYPEDLIGSDTTEICGKIIPPVIDCPDGCVPILIMTGETGPGQFNYEWDCDCSGTNGGGSGPPLNDCDCPTLNHIRKPAGCVTVENTTTSLDEGVRRVRVIIKDTYFGKPYKTWTSASSTSNGCWKYNRRFKGSLYLWIDFKNEYSFERCYVPSWEIVFGAAGMIIKYLQPVRHYVGRIWGPNFSNIEVVHYPHWSTVGTKEQILWGAATVNNEVQVFNDQATDINQLPSSLDIYLMPHLGSGSALMSSYGTLNALFGLSATVLAPDLMIGLDRPSRRWQDLLSYHEMAHAGHFTQVGPLWWKGLIAAEVINGGLDLITWDFPLDPYGDGSLITDGLIAVAESWAENIGREFANFDRENLLFENGYVPEGLYNDLEDINTTTFDITNGIRDNVNGFTRGQMFDALTFSVTNIEDYRERLRPSLPPGNTVMNYDTLFADYIR